MSCPVEIMKERRSIFWVLAFLFLFAAGCTEYERNGFSAIPQNTPASWEVNPFGDLRN